MKKVIYNTANLKQIILSFFLFLTPSSSLNAKIQHQASSHRSTKLELFFTPKNEAYNTPILLTIKSKDPHVKVHYTIDGSIPTLQSPLYIRKFALPTSNWSSPLVSDHSRWGFIKYQNNKRTQVAYNIRARGYIKNLPVTKVYTQTYLLKRENKNTLPIISITIPPQDLFSEEDGIYTLGKTFKKFTSKRKQFKTTPLSFPANFTQRGRDWKRNAALEFFSKEGIRLINQNILLGISGCWSSYFYQKSFSIKLPKKIKHPLLFNQSRITLRNGGSTNDYLIAPDALAHQITKGLSFRNLKATPVELFLNGEYWGLYYIRERWTNKTIRSKYNISTKKITIIKDHYVKSLKYKSEQNDYNKFRHFIRTQDLNLPHNRKQLNRMMNLDNYIDYFIAKVYFASCDFPLGNSYQWRIRNKQSPGKWNILFQDIDCSFEVNDPTLKFATNFDQSFPKHHSSPIRHKFWKNLLEAEWIFQRFLIRFQSVVNTQFAPDVVTTKMNSFFSKISAALKNQIERWGTPVNQSKSKRQMLEFAKHRVPIIMEHVQKTYDLPPPIILEIESNINLNNNVTINSLPIQHQGTKWQGSFFPNSQIEITAGEINKKKFLKWSGDVKSKNKSIRIEIKKNTKIKLVYQNKK